MRTYPTTSPLFLQSPGIFFRCLAVSIMLHCVLFLAYYLATGGFRAVSTDDIIIQDAEVDFQDFPYEEEMKKGSAAPHDNEWVEGTGKNVSNEKIDDRPSGTDEKDEQGYFYSARSDSPPKPVINFDLRLYFPREARLANIKKQTVIVRIHVDEYGVLNSAEVVSAPAGYGFDEAALKIVHRARFRPGILHGKPVPMVHKLPIRFVLE